MHNTIHAPRSYCAELADGTKIDATAADLDLMDAAKAQNDPDFEFEISGGRRLRLSQIRFWSDSFR